MSDVSLNLSPSGKVKAFFRRLQGEPSQPERVEDDRNRAEAHRRARDDQAQQEAKDRVEHARSDRQAERVVDEGEEKVFANVHRTARHSRVILSPTKATKTSERTGHLSVALTVRRTR